MNSWVGRDNLRALCVLRFASIAGLVRQPRSIVSDLSRGTDPKLSEQAGSLLFGITTEPNSDLMIRFKADSRA